MKYLRQGLATSNETEDELMALDAAGYVNDTDREMLQAIRSICAMLAVFIEKVDGSIRKQSRRPRRPRPHRPKDPDSS